jgi:Protein of unknown function (DUF1045)
MNVKDAYRHAVYFAPRPEHALWIAGCSWLGRDASQSGDRSPPARAHVSEPWRYGFHGTLRPPMRLTGSHEEWRHAVASLAARTRRFSMPALRVDWLGEFIALMPVQPLGGEHPLEQLADACVLTLERFRSTAQPERTVHADLSERQRDHLQRYGYPYVLEDWRFHMTLSNSLTTLGAQDHAALKARARDHFAAALYEPLVCDSVCIFVEPQAGAPFLLSERFDLAS